MTLPHSGPLTFSNLQTEFGGSNPISLSEYYAGAGRVPSGTSGDSGAIPSSGTISISKFYGSHNYGPFTASQSGFISSGSSITGPGHSITQGFSLTGTLPKSGGPTSGSFNYFWSVVSGAGDIVCSNPNIESPNFTGSISVPQQPTLSKSAVWNVHIVDTVSGFTYDLHVNVQYTYTNNTG